MSTTIAVGLSGGVDSSVAALLLKQQGHNVIGIFMKNWEEKDENGVCTSEQDAIDARVVADKIGIPLHVVNFSQEYKKQVFSQFLSDIEDGLTPNPDVLCNSQIKFGHLLDYAKKLGASKLATGHYADVEYLDGVYMLKQSHDKHKDQTYFLVDLSQEQLAYALFPLNGIDKHKVREIASKYDLITAQKKDSTGICFIGERNFKNFLNSYVKGTAGDIVTIDGKKIGTHDGLPFYTIGQKKGLMIGGQKGYEGASFCVVEKCAKTNRLIVAVDGTDAVFNKKLTADKFNFTGKIYKANEEYEFDARIRHGQPLQKCKAMFDLNGGVVVEFKDRQRAVTTGQYVALYDNQYVVGGGKISSKG